MLTLKHVLDSLKARHGSVPQPEGKEVVEAYKAGDLGSESDMLHVIAVLLAEARRVDRVWTDDGFWHAPKSHHPADCAGCTSDESRYGTPIRRIG